MHNVLRAQTYFSAAEIFRKGPTGPIAQLVERGLCTAFSLGNKSLGKRKRTRLRPRVRIPLGPTPFLLGKEKALTFKRKTNPFFFRKKESLGVIQRKNNCQEKNKKITKSLRLSKLFCLVRNCICTPQAFLRGKQH